MNEKPEALRLADDFDRDAKRELFRYLDLDKAAAELRRLHAENERLREALRTVLDQSWNGPLPDWARDEAASVLQEVPR